MMTKHCKFHLELHKFIKYTMLVAIVLVCVFVTYLFGYFLLQHRKYALIPMEKLPPGSMGLPIIGETVQLALRKVVFRAKRKRYGPIFKTHLFGQPTIRVSDKENVRKIISGENKIVQSCYPTSIRKLLGPHSLTMSSGEQHKIRKQEVMHFLSKDFLRLHNGPFCDLIDIYMKRWIQQPSVVIYKECRSLFVDLAAKYLVGMDTDSDTNSRIKSLYEVFTSNMFGFPVNFPGFGLYKAIRAKKKLLEIFKDLTKRNGQDVCEYQSVLAAYGALQGDKNEGLFDAILDLLWNASETISSAAFAIVYNLSQNSHVFHKLQKELENEDIGVKSEDAIPYSECVVKETLRVMPPVGGAYRTVSTSFEMGGYTIPKDWTIIFGIRETHENDPAIENPKLFNPDRWLDGSSSNRISYLPFGGGVRACPGQTYARMVLKLFTELLCHKCSWKMLTKDPELELYPSPKPKHNLKVCFLDSMTAKKRHLLM